MRTEDDVRAALTLIAERAPAPNAAGASDGKPPRGHRRAVAVLAVAAATAAAVAIPALIVAGRSSTAPQSARTGEQILRRTFDVRLAGWRETEREMAGTHQAVTVVNSRHNYCRVTMFEPGVFDRRRIPAGSAELTVGGKPGYYAQLVGQLPPDPMEVFAPAPSPSSGPDAPRQWAVVWAYSEDVWAVSNCEPGGDSAAERARVRQTAELMAAATAPTSRPLRVPFTAGHLPAGPELVVAYSDQLGAESGNPPGSATFQAVLADLPNRQAMLTIRYTPAFELGGNGTGVERLTVNGRRATFDGTYLVIAGKRFNATLQRHESADYSRAELVRIAERLEFASDPADESTWFDAEDALPE